MLKPALDALGSLKIFDVAALVVAFPLATTIQSWLAERPSASPADAFAAAIVLAIVLLATSAWIHQLLSARVVRSSVLDLARPVRTFAIVAGILAAVVLLSRQHAQSRLLVALYCAFALALLVGARLGWRALAAAAQGAPIPRASRGRGVGAIFAAPARGFGATSRREADARPAEHGAGALGSAEAPSASASAPPPPEPPRAPGVRRSELVLQNLRSCMDEVSYTPGSPNVLSMTKWVSGEGRARRAEAAAAVRPAPGEGEATVSRTDSGDRTVLRIAGVLDAVTAPRVRPAIEAVVAERRAAVTVDLSALKLIDSSGVGLVVGLYKRCGAYGGSVQVAGLKDQPLSIFRLLRLDRIFALS